MAIQVQILQPADGDEVSPVFSVDGTALNMGQGPITIGAMLVILDLSSAPIVKPPMAPNPVAAAGPGVFTWRINFTAADNVQPGDYALYAIGHDSTNTVAGQEEIAITVFDDAFVARKHKQKKPKKNGKKK